MTRVAASLALWLGLAVLACEDQATQGEGEGWVGGELPPGNGGLPPGDPAGADDGDWDEAPHAVWFGEIEVQDGGYGVASGGFMAVDVDDGVAYEACVAVWTSLVVAEPTDCNACEFAVELEYGEVEIAVDVDCAGWGFDPASVEAMRIGVGYGGGETLHLRDDNGEWIEYGYAELGAGYFYFELED
jgi:hypothetical protein